MLKVRARSDRRAKCRSFSSRCSKPSTRSLTTTSHISERSSRPRGLVEAAAIEAAYRVLFAYFPANPISVPICGVAGRDSGRSREARGIATGADAAETWFPARATARHRRRSTCHIVRPWRVAAHARLPGCGWSQFPVAVHDPIRGPEHSRRPGLDRTVSSPAAAVHHSSQYAKDYNEVLRVGGVASTARPPDRADVARFYAATSPA